jgi:hypothetical protein
MNKAIISVTLPCLLLLTAFTCDAGNTNALDWKQLSSEQRAVLKNFEGQWQDIPDERRQRLITGASRWSEMTADQRARAKLRL